MPFGFEFLVIILMLVLNGIFAAYEMALASVSLGRITVLVNEKRKGAVESAYMKSHMEASLAMVQLGITLVGAVAAAIGGAGVGDTLAPYLQESWRLPNFFAELLSLVVFIIPLTVVTIVFAELVPKMLAINNKERVVLSLSPVMQSFVRLAYPVISVLERWVKRIVKAVSKKHSLNTGEESAHGFYELKAAASLARASRLLGAREEKIVLSAAQLSSRPVRDILIPVTDIFMICRDSSLLEAFLKAHLDMHTRFPVCTQADDPQSILGYVNFKDITVALKVNPEDPTIRGIMRPILRVEASLSISQVMEKMIQDKTHIAIALSPDTKVLGMVTLEDIMEELVGEIEDEFDRWLTHIQPYGNAWLMGGGVSMEKVLSSLGLERGDKFVADRALSLSEWCERKNGRPIAGGDVVELDGIRVVPRKFRRKKMLEALVTKVG